MRAMPVLIGAILIGNAAGVLAADPPMDRTTPTKSELMKDCIRKHQSGDVNLSKSELNRLCKEEIKQQKAIADAPPPQDAPRP